MNLRAIRQTCMSKSQETYLKKQREKKRLQKKKEKMENKNLRRDQDKGGLEIDWDSAPENLTLSKEELDVRAETKQINTNK